MEQHNHPHHHLEEQNNLTQDKVTNKNLYILPAVILLGAVIISGAIFYNTKQFINFGIKGFAGTAQPSGSGLQALNIPGAQTQIPPPDSGPVTVSVDDDPVLGRKDAPITIIEFSDYECPFCKRYFTETFPEIKKNYIDTCKVKLVYRDFPLPFHDTLATTEAMAANCSREQGGDAVYFKYHDEIFKRTKSNGQGMLKDELYKIAKDLNLNDGKFRTCLDSEKYKDEVSKDAAAGASFGVSGTPTMFIGKSNSDGKINGVRVIGAQPYAAFKTIIDQLLK
ncbi:MAG: DsbA family protein [Patescibacteria group bacterium]